MNNRCFFYRAHVVDVHDGDTITVDVDLGFSMALKRLKVRLSGLDTAEITSKDHVIKEQAIKARDWLRLQILNKDVFLESGGLDKYGRWLGRIHTPDGICCNDMLLSEGLALAYNGGKKPTHSI